MALDTLIQTAWAEHGDHPDAVAEKLTGAPALLEKASQVAPLTRVVVHVYGEHLGRWADGIALLESVARRSGCDAPGAATIARSIATLRFASGDRSALDDFAGEERAQGLAAAATILAGRYQLTEAIDVFSAALRLAEAGVPDGSPLLGALAVAGNNLAVTLENRPARSERERDGMVAAAEAGLNYWKRAGTWLEEERAEYRLARSLLKAGRAADAVAAAARCVAVCEKNDAPPFERFFAHAILALARRAGGDEARFVAAKSEAIKWHELVDSEKKQWCKDDLNEIMN